MYIYIICVCSMNIKIYCTYKCNAMHVCMSVCVPVRVIFVFILIVAHEQPADVYLLARGE